MLCRVQIKKIQEYIVRCTGFHDLPENFNNIEKGIEHDTINSLLTTQSRFITTLRKKALESIVRKGENAGNH